MKTVRLFTEDSVRDWRPRGTYDEILEALPSRKVMVSGTTWQGDLKPLVDATAAAIKPLVTPLTNGAPSQGALDLGRKWADSLRKTLRDAIANATSNTRNGVPDVDIGEVMEAVDQLHANMAIRNPVMVGAAVDRLRAASNGVDDGYPNSGFAEITGVGSGENDSRRAGLTRDNHIIRERRNDAARLARFIVATRPKTATADRAAQVAGQVRDHMAAASRATNTRDHIRAIAEGNKAFWDARR